MEESRRLERERQKKIVKPTVEKPKDDKPKLTYEERKEFNRLEKQIMVLEEKKEKITEQFNNPDLTAEEIQKLSIELGEVKNEIEEKEMRWMELAELA